MGDPAQETTGKIESPMENNDRVGGARKRREGGLTKRLIKKQE